MLLPLHSANTFIYEVYTQKYNLVICNLEHKNRLLYMLMAWALLALRHCPHSDD